METENFLASIWGLILIFVPLALLINPKKIKGLLLAMKDEAVAFSCGAVSFIAGAATVLLTNVWQINDWRTIVTILGWIAILRGFLLMFWEDGAQKIISKIKDSEWLSYGLLVAAFVGLVCFYFGFTGI